MHLTLRTIPHAQQRYNTAGDWYWHDATLVITASGFPGGQPAYEHLIQLHEVVEALLCIWTGVNQKTVDAWDKAHPDGEPGDRLDAPYHRQHVIASVVERLAAELLGVNWPTYEAAIDQL